MPHHVIGWDHACAPVVKLVCWRSRGGWCAGGGVPGYLLFEIDWLIGVEELMFRMIHWGDSWDAVCALVAWAGKVWTLWRVLQTGCSSRGGGARLLHPSPKAGSSPRSPPCRAPPSNACCIFPPKPPFQRVTRQTDTVSACCIFPPKLPFQV